LLQCFGGHDQIARWRRGRLDRQLHFGEAMSVRCDHAHVLWSKLPEHAIENRSAFFRRHRERCVRDKLLQLARANAPTLVEAHGWERWELITRKTENFEMRASAVERDTLFAGSSDFHWRWWKLARDFAQLLRRNCDRA